MFYVTHYCVRAHQPVTSLPQHKHNDQIVMYKEYKVPLHTLLAASAEVLPLQLSMLVVMVLMMLLLMVMLEVWVVRSGRAGARWAGGSSVDNVFGRAFVDDMWVVAIGGAVVVLFSQMLG